MSTKKRKLIFIELLLLSNITGETARKIIFKIIVVWICSNLCDDFCR